MTDILARIIKGDDEATLTIAVDEYRTAYRVRERITALEYFREFQSAGIESFFVSGHPVNCSRDAAAILLNAVRSSEPDIYEIRLTHRDGAILHAKGRFYPTSFMFGGASSVNLITHEDERVFFHVD